MTIGSAREMTCHDLTRTTTGRPGEDVSVKEFCGRRDITQNIGFIIKQYESMPTSCHNLGIPSDLLRTTILKDPNTYVLISTVNGKALGFCVLVYTPRTNTTHQSMYVYILCAAKHPNHSGVGRQIMEHAMTICLRHRVPYLDLDAVPTAVGFYKRLGFDESRKRFRNDGSSVRMKLNVLWYFSCWIRSNLSENDKKNIRMVFH